MELKLLKSLRVLVPALIVLVCAWPLGKTTGLWALQLPDLANANKSLTVLLLGTLYYFTPLREISNQPYSDTVNENLRAGLVRIADRPDSPSLYTWSKLQAIFYPLVDNDNSLKVKASLAYGNGIFWTSVADCRAITVLYFYASLIIADMGNDGALRAAAIFLVLTTVSFPISGSLTKRHIGIGNQQLDIIEIQYKEKLKAMFNAAYPRSVGDLG